MQGQARVNFGHAVVLLVDGLDAHERVRAARLGVGTTLTRRELALAGNVLEEGRLLIIALNKADGLDSPARATVIDALNRQVHSRLLCARPYASHQGTL
jgi:predicted GTPase